jgi:hypothetical protein
MATHPQTNTNELSKTSILLRNMLAGALGACVAEAISIPIDASKVRLQL